MGPIGTEATDRDWLLLRKRATKPLRPSRVSLAIRPIMYRIRWPPTIAASRAPLFKRHACIDILSCSPLAVNLSSMPSAAKDPHPALVCADHLLPPDADQMIFGPLDIDDHSLLSPSSLRAPWDHPRDYAFNQPVSPIMSDQTTSPRRASDFDIPDASPGSPFYDPASFGPFDDVHSILDLDDSYLSQWLHDSQLPVYDPASSSPIPIRGTQSDPQSLPTFTYGHQNFAHNASFSPSDLSALHPLPRSLSPTEASDGGYLSSPGLRLTSISPADASLRPPPWASQLWGPSQYPPTSPSRHSATHAPLSENPYTAKRQRFQPRREASSGLVFQSSSAPSPLQSNVPPMTRSYSRRSESVSISDDRDATIRRKKKSPPLQEEPPKDTKSVETGTSILSTCFVVILIRIRYLRYSSPQVLIETAQIGSISVATLLYRLDPTPPSNKHAQVKRCPSRKGSRSRVCQPHPRTKRSMSHFVLALLPFDTVPPALQTALLGS